MSRSDGERNLFLIGALVGIVSGVLVGTVATGGIGEQLVRLVNTVSNRLLGREQSVHFELLGQ